MYVRNLSPSLSSLASPIVAAEEGALPDRSGGRNRRAEAPTSPGASRLGSEVPGNEPQRGDSSAPAAVSTQPRNQVGSSQRWAGGTLAATPKTIPCPGSPAAAAPASFLSTSPTRSDSDEPAARRRRHQVKGLRCQVEFPVTAGTATPRAPRGLFGGGGILF